MALVSFPFNNYLLQISINKLNSYAARLNFARSEAVAKNEMVAIEQYGREERSGHDADVIDSYGRMKKKTTRMIDKRNEVVMNEARSIFPLPGNSMRVL